jgi:putative oxidoreductase
VNEVDLASLLLRLVVGFSMLAHGWNHHFRGGKLAGTGRWFESIGIRPGWLHARLATYSELVAGPLLMLGLLTPLGCAAVIGTMGVAFVANHLPVGYFVFKRPTEGYEYILLLIAAAVAIAGLGGGKFSLDNALDLTDDLSGADIAGWTFLAGAAAAALVLAIFWRKPAKEPAA